MQKFDLDIILFTHGPKAYAPARLFKEAKKLKLKFKIVKYNDVNITFTSGGFKLNLRSQKMPIPKSVFLRGLGEDSIYNPIRTAIVTWFKSQGSKVLNERSFSVWPSLDKMTQHINLAKSGISIAESFCFTSKEELKNWAKKSYPFIAKDIVGSNGVDVFKITNDKDLGKLLERFNSSFKIKTLLFQKFLPKAEDIRVIVLGGKIVGAMKRMARPGNFLSNYSQGGLTEKYQIGEDKEARSLALITAKLFKLDYVGVDLMKNEKGNWVVLEVNRACQFEGFEKTTGINVASAICEYLTK
jgi:RimK family alpha-L-glutamate ligase